MSDAPPSPHIPLDAEVWERTPPESQALILELLGTVVRSAEEIARLNERIRLLAGQRFGPTSEKTKKTDCTPESEKPAAEAEPELGYKAGHKSESGAADGCDKADEEQPAAPSPPPIPRGRKRFPPELPRREVVLDVPETEKQCGCGDHKSCIGYEESERLGFRPAQIFVWLYRRAKYACRRCEGTEDVPPQAGTAASPTPSETTALATGEDAKPPLSASMTSTATASSPRPVVSIAPPAVQLIPKGIPSNGLLVHIIIAKVVDALPLYRQEAQFLRYGVNIRRVTMCGWLIKVGQLLAPVMDALRVEILAGRLIGIDETPFQVLDEPGRKATTKSYMWVFAGGPPGKPAVEFVYDMTRSSDVPRRYLEGYRGDVQTDGYVGYEFLLKWTWIVLLGCWVHVRRKFVEVIKACPPELRGKGGIAQEAVKRIRVLYRIERYADQLNMTEDERRDLRQEKAKPVVAAMKTWLEEVQPAVPPKTLLGDAISYALEQWPRLEHYLERGYRRPDNNLVENRIRPFAVGRKNWLFFVTPEGAAAMAAFHSLTATATLNGLDPARYLRALFDRLPYARSPEDHRALLPQYIDRELLAVELPEQRLFQTDS